MRIYNANFEVENNHILMPLFNKEFQLSISMIQELSRLESYDDHTWISFKISGKEDLDKLKCFNDDDNRFLETIMSILERLNDESKVHIDLFEHIIIEVKE